MTSAKIDAPIHHPSRARRLWTLVASFLLWLAASACSGAHAPLTQHRELEALMQVAAYPNSETVTVLIAMQQFLATHREWEGFEFFGRLATEQPARRTFFRTLLGVMQARVANDVFLL